MPSYRKRPLVTRFKRQVTKPGRDIKVARVERRERKRTLRKPLKMKPLRKRLY